MDTTIIQVLTQGEQTRRYNYGPFNIIQLYLFITFIVNKENIRSTKPVIKTTQFN